MRNKDHHLLKRGRKYSIRYDIPSDLRDCYPGILSRTVFEALGTSDKVEARKKRDQRLSELEQEWYSLRREKRGRKNGNGAALDASSWEDWAAQVKRSGTNADQETIEYVLSDGFDELVEQTLRQRVFGVSPCGTDWGS